MRENAYFICVTTTRGARAVVDSQRVTSYGGTST